MERIRSLNFGEVMGFLVAHTSVRSTPMAQSPSRDPPYTFLPNEYPSLPITALVAMVCILGNTTGCSCTAVDSCGADDAPGSVAEDPATLQEVSKSSAESARARRPEVFKVVFPHGKSSA